MKRVVYAAVCAGVMSGCASLGSIDDGGRAARQVENAPTAVAAQDDVLGDASVQLASRKFDLRRKEAKAADARRDAAATVRPCDASRHQEWVGTDIAGVDFRELPRVYRVVPNGAMVTQEYREERLSLYLDANSIVTRVVCG